MRDHFTADELPAAARLSALLKASWKTGLASVPSLDDAALIAKAERIEKGALIPGPWRDALAVLTADLETSAALNPLGRTIAHGQLVRILRQRIRAERLWHDQPHILDRPLLRPVIVLGQMRSGTTRLHRLLACDPRFAFTRLHETLDPVSANRTRARASAAFVRSVLEACNPALRRIHPTAADAPEEEFGLHAFSLHGAMFEAQWHVPRFAQWTERRDLASVYREFRRLLQTLSWRRGDPSGSVQLLKAPQFMADLDSLLDEFPDARVIALSRDPEAVLGSTASLVWNQRRVQSDDVERRDIGPEWRAKIERREAAAQAALSRLSDDRVIRIDFAAMNDGWRTEIRRVYEFLRLSPPSGWEDRMAAVAGSRRHHGHDYRLGDFGIERRALA